MYRFNQKFKPKRSTHKMDYAMDVTLDLEIEACVEPGCPESGRFGPPENYDPGEPSHVSALTVYAVFVDLTDKKHRIDITDYLSEEDRNAICEDAISEWWEAEEGRFDAAADAAYEAWRESRFEQ